MNFDRAMKLAKTIHRSSVYKRNNGEHCIVLIIGAQLVTLDDEGVKVYASNEGLIRNMHEDLFTLGTRLFCEHCPQPVKCIVCGNP